MSTWNITVTDIIQIEIDDAARQRFEQEAPKGGWFGDNPASDAEVAYWLWSVGEGEVIDTDVTDPEEV